MKLTTKNVLLAIDRQKQMQRVQEALCISGPHMESIIGKLLARKLIIYDNRLDMAILTRKGYRKVGRDILEEVRQRDMYNLLKKQAKQQVAEQRRARISALKRSWSE